MLVVPAVDSALNIQAQHKRWVLERRRRGFERDPSIEAEEPSTPADEQVGVFARDAVRHKHFRLTELTSLLRGFGFDRILEADRVTYSWDTEFEAPTRFLDRDASIRRPFDWLIVAERGSAVSESGSAVSANDRGEVSNAATMSSESTQKPQPPRPTNVLPRRKASHYKAMLRAPLVETTPASVDTAPFVAWSIASASSQRVVPPLAAAAMVPRASAYRIARRAVAQPSRELTLLPSRQTIVQMRAPSDIFARRTPVCQIRQVR